MVSAPVSITVPVGGGVGAGPQATEPFTGVDENLLLWNVGPGLGSPVPSHWSFVWSEIPTAPLQSLLLKNAQIPALHVAVGVPHMQAPQPRVSMTVPTLCGVA
jgi:hypothetical protein